MTWVAWRQQRVQLFVSLGFVLAAVAAWTVVTLAGGSFAVLGLIGSLDPVGDEMWLLPSLLGIFAGAPLFAGELERGTHVFGLSQSVSRRRWVVTKLMVAGAPIVLLMLVLGMAVYWGSSPDSGENPFANFASIGVVPAGYTALAFCVSAAAGAWWRSIIGAVAITVVLVVGTLILLGGVARPHYLPPEPVSVTVYEYRHGEPAIMSDQDSWWVGDTEYRNDNGDDLNGVMADCGYDIGCAEQGGVTTVVDHYQPFDRFWAFQGIELGITVVVSAAALGLGAWGLRRRLR